MRRPLIYTLILLLLLVYVPVDAQSNTLGLSDADYKLLNDANSSAINQFAFAFDTHIAVEGLETFAAKIDVAGSGMVDKTAPALDILLKGTARLSGKQDYPVDMEVRWLDDTLYVNPGTMWQAIKPASGYLARGVSQYIGLSADEAAMKAWDVSGIEGLSDVLAAVMKIEPQTFLTAKRLDDDALGKVKTAHFQLTADLQALLQSDVFVDVVAAFAQAQGNDLVILDHAQLVDAVRATGAMFKGATATIEEYVGLDDHLIHRVSIKLDMPIDPTVGGYEDAAFKVTWTLDARLSALNEPQSITAPEDARSDTYITFPTQPQWREPGAGTTQYVSFVTVSELGYGTSIEVKAGDRVTITVRGLGLDYDAHVRLATGNNVTLAENDDHESNAFGVNYPDAQIVDYVVQKDGFYEVMVDDINGEPGSFVLTITIRR